MIVAQIGQLLGSVQSGALGRLTQASLPVKTAVRLKAILDVVNEALRDYDAKRIALCAKFGVLNPDSGNYEFETPELSTEFQTRASLLLQNTINIQSEPLALSGFFSSHSLSDRFSSHSLSVSDLGILEWLIETDPIVFTTTDIATPDNTQTQYAVS